VATRQEVNDWKVWGLIWGLGIIGVVAILPYVAELQGPALREAAPKAGMGVPALLAISAVQGIVFLGISSRIGIWAARRAGLTFPVFDALGARKPVSWSGSAALVAITAGLLGGALDVALDVFAFAPPAAIALNGSQPAAWKGFLASFYGGFSEEILLRLFFLSLLVLGFRRVVLGRNSAGRPTPSAAFWTANVLVALAFGLAHLPGAAAIVPLTASLVVRAIALNGILGLLFGEFYRRWGFEMAILAHFCADIALHVVPPLVS
jgi:hypothetical protein